MSLSLRKSGLLVVLLVCTFLHEARGQSEYPSKYASSQPDSPFSLTTDSIPPSCRASLLPVPLTVKIQPYSTLTDSTPPSPPQNVTVVNESIHSLLGRWDEAIDPESGIDYYAYAIGTEPGTADITWWQSTGLSLSSYGESMIALELSEGDTVYFSVYAGNGAGQTSEIVSVGPIVFLYESLGNSSNEITIDFAGPWSQAELSDLEWFLDRMLPIIKESYGPPSHSYTVILVKDSLYSSTAVFFPSINEIHMSQLYPQLLTHEMIHAFRDNVILSSDEIWRFDPTLSGFEESFAQGISYVSMNRYLQLYPADPVVPGNTIYGSSFEWDYDFHNIDILTTTDFWSDGGGTGIFWLRYEMGAAAILKILQDYPDFALDFNRNYYLRLNADHSLTTSRGLMREIISNVTSTIEGHESTDWIDRQRIFDCMVRNGRKIFVSTQHYPDWDEYLIFQNIFYYETFLNGSEWAWWDSEGGEWVYHNLNGSAGTGILRDFHGDILWQSDLLIEPIQNPPEYNGFGWETKHLSTDDDTSPWPGGDPDDFILDLTELGLYKLNLRFGVDSTQVLRVMGDSLRNVSGVFGAVFNGTGGRIFLNHEDYPEESPIPIVNGAFHGDRAWASIPNPDTGYKDSSPGRVFVIYIDEEGNAFSDQRNIDLGSWAGNQLFLFDTLDMTRLLLPEPVQLISPADGEVIQTDSVHFVWHQGTPDVSRYWFELDIDSIMGNPSIDSTLMAPDTTWVLGSPVVDQTLWWRVRAKNTAGWGSFSELRSFSVVTTGVDIPAEEKITFHLTQNYPNPFNGPTKIGYSTPEASNVTLKVYDLRGRVVEVLVNEEKKPGRYEVVWEPHGLGSGVYFFRLEIADLNGSPGKRIIRTKKIIIAK